MSSKTDLVSKKQESSSTRQHSLDRDAIRSGVAAGSLPRKPLYERAGQPTWPLALKLAALSQSKVLGTRSAAGKAELQSSKLLCTFAENDTDSP